MYDIDAALDFMIDRIGPMALAEIFLSPLDGNFYASVSGVAGSDKVGTSLGVSSFPKEAAEVCIQHWRQCEFEGPEVLYERSCKSRGAEIHTEFGRVIS